MTYDNFTIKLIAYKCTFKNATFKLTDHDKSDWVSNKDLNTYKTVIYLLVMFIPLVYLYLLLDLLLLHYQMRCEE